jgi:haloalkane dehalogenase
MQTAQAAPQNKNVLEAPSFIETSTAKLAYWKIGQGPDLVFFHGWPLHSATYRRLVPLLADTFTCHVFDLPGAGQTIDKSKIELEPILQASRELIQKLGLTRYAFVAHDSGALFARLLAMNNPNVVAIVSGNTEIPRFHSPLIKRLTMAAKIPGGLTLLRQGMKLRKVRCSNLGFKGAFTSDDFIEGEFYRLVSEPLLASATAFARPFSMLENFDFSIIDRLESIHSKISAPVRFIWGKEDRIFPLKYAELMLPQFPGGATMHKISGRCFAHEEFSEEFASAAKSFLEECFLGKSKS